MQVQCLQAKLNGFEPEKTGCIRRMFEIVLLALVAGFILLRLRSELGKKTGNEPLPPAARPAPTSYRDGSVSEPEVVDIEPEQPAPVFVGDPEVQKGLDAISHADRSFDLPDFLAGAQTAYGMILEAFWAGDRETLKDMLDEQVYAQFESALSAREEKGHVLENKLLDVLDAKLVGAQLLDKTAELAVQLKAEIIAITRDKDGKVVEGNVSDAVEVNDRWTFARDTKSKDPSWMLVATRAG